MLGKENNSSGEEVQSTVAVAHPRDLAEEKRKKSLLSKISSYNDKKKLIKDSLQILDTPQNKKVKFTDDGCFSEVQCAAKPSVDCSAEINENGVQYCKRNKQENCKSTVSSPLCKDFDGEVLDPKTVPLGGKANRDKLQRKKKKKMSAEYTELDDKQEEETEVQPLFGSSDDDDDNVEDDKRFSVNKNRKLIELQSRFATDRRFMLDERFQEEETNEETTDELKSEKEMEKEIVYSILGQRPTRKLNATKPVTSFVRYNPLNEAHRSFEKPPDHEVDNSDEKKVKNSKKPVIPANEVPEEVLKNKFYTVSSNLKNRLQNGQESSFSVFSLFDHNGDPAEKVEEEKVEEEKFKEEEVEVTKNFRELPGLFENELSIVDDTSESKNAGDSENIKRSAGVIKETFFFTKNDPRFLEGLEFSEGKDFSSDFKTKRRLLKQVVRSKIKTNQDKSQQLKRRNRFRTINVQKRKKVY